ncbi:RHS repeat-associated core domain-containing protein [Thermoproteota archaeon]
MFKSIHFKRKTVLNSGLFLVCWISLFMLSPQATASEAGPAGGFNQNYYGMSEDMNTTFGNLLFTETDLSLPGRISEMPLSISRIYNSRDYKSNPDLLTSCTRKWGAWAGKGWRFSFAQRAFIFIPYNAVGNGIEDSMVLIEGTDGYQVYQYSKDLGSGSYEYSSNEEMNFNIVTYDESGNTILLDTTNGIKVNFTVQFLQESHKVGASYQLLGIKGYQVQCVSKLEELQTIGTNYYYTQYDSDYMDEHIEAVSTDSYGNDYFNVDGMSMGNQLGGMMNACSQVALGYHNGVASSDYYINKTIYRDRVSSIVDSFGRTITIGYGDTWNESTQNAECMISNITYTNVNGNPTIIKYKYNTAGYLTAVQHGSLPEKKYEYYNYAPAFKYYLYLWAGLPIGHEYYYYPTKTGHDDIIEYSLTEEYAGKYLYRIISPMDSCVQYQYKDCLSVNPSHEEIYPEATFPVVVRKFIYKNYNAGSPSNLEYYLEYNPNYPDTIDEEYPEKGCYEPTSNVKIHFFNYIEIFTHFGAEELKKQTISNSQARISWKQQGDFKTVTNWDYDKLRVNSTEKYTNGVLQSKTEMIYDDTPTGAVKFNNVKEINIYKGSSGTPYQQTIKTFWGPEAPAYANKFFHLVKTSKIVKDSQEYSPSYYEYTAYGRPEKVYQALSATNLKKTLTYQSDGRLLRSETNGLSGYTEYEYNDSTTYGGKSVRSIKKKFMIGAAEQYSESNYMDINTGKALFSVDINGFESAMTYDDDARLISQTAPNSGFINYNYDEFFSLNKTVINANGKSTTIYHDNFGRKVSSHTPDASEDDTYYYYHFGNNVERVMKNSTQLGYRAVKEYTYDEYLRPIDAETLLGITTSVYDDPNNKVTIQEKTKGGSIYRQTVKNKNEIGQLTQSNFNAFGSESYITQYTDYNAFGSAEDVIDPRGLHHEFAVDNFGRTTEIYHTSSTGAGFRKEKTEYDPVTDLVTTMRLYDTDGSASWVYTFQYDDFGRPYETWLDGVKKEWLTYDTGGDNAKGKMTTAENDECKVVYDYDEMGQVKKHTITVKAMSHTYDIDTTYTTDGYVASTVFPDTKAITYHYNANKQLEQIKYNGQVIVSYTYNSNGTLNKMTYGNNYSRNYIYQYEYLLREMILKNASSQEIFRQSYTYDTKNNVDKTMLEDVYSGEPCTRDYTYSEIDELVQTDVTTAGDVKTYTYDYDKNGNSTLFSLPTNNSTIATTHSIDSDLDRISLKTYPDNRDIQFVYDKQGNLSWKLKRVNESVTKYYRYFYNYQKQLSEVKENDVTIAQYGYDPNGQCIYSNVTKPGFEAEKFFYWDVSGQLIAEGSASNPYLVRYIYSGNEKIAAIYSNGEGEEKIYYFINNAQGTPWLCMDTDGHKMYYQKTDEYGNLEQDVVGEKREINFTGKKYEYATHLYYFYQRWYDPEIGRFLSEDPAGQNMNPYLYASNNPLGFIDPNGEWFFSAALSVFGPLGTIAGAALDAGMTSAAVSGVAAAATGGDVGEAMMNGFKSGALSGGLAAGIGELGTALQMGDNLAFKTVAHGISGGAQSAASGGDFKSGFLGGSIGNIAGAAMGDNVVQRIAVGGMAAGATTALSGGDFMQGFQSGACNQAFNWALHEGMANAVQAISGDIYDNASYGLGIVGNSQGSSYLSLLSILKVGLDYSEGSISEKEALIASGMAGVGLIPVVGPVVGAAQVGYNNGTKINNAIDKEIYHHKAVKKYGYGKHPDRYGLWNKQDSLD